MPNYQSGTDAGNFLTHPVSGDNFQALLGPYATTYNGLKRPNTGVTDGDGTADFLSTAFRKLLDNIDITVTESDLSISNEPLKVVVRAQDGSIEVGELKATSIILDQGISGRIYGGTW